MLLFCPSCSNMLIVTSIPAAQTSPEEADLAGKNRFQCRTCPYQMVLDRRYYERKTFEFKGTEDVLGGADSWKNVDRTDVQCPNPRCESKQAYFRQVQIRSADEPMTNFYRCVECGHDWREG